MRYVAPSRDAYHKYYNVVANPMLWFIQHYLWDLGWHPDIRANEIDAWQNGYLVGEPAVRRGRGGRGAPGAGRAPAPRPGRRRGDALVMLHDYHLYCVAPHVRAAAPAPSCTSSCTSPGRRPTTGACCPTHMRRAVFEGLLGNDVVAFHTRHYVRTSCAAAPTCSTSRSTGALRRPLRRPRGVGARLPGLDRPGVAARRRRLASARSRPSASCCGGGASTCCCASTASTRRKNIIRGFVALRPLPRAAPGVQGAHHVPRAAAAVTRGRRGVRHLPRARGAARRRHQHAARHDRLDARSTCASRTTSR